MVGHGGSSAGSYLADPTSPIPSHCASIVVTSTLRVKQDIIWVSFPLVHFIILCTCTGLNVDSREHLEASLSGLLGLTAYILHSYWCLAWLFLPWLNMYGMDKESFLFAKQVPSALCEHLQQAIITEEGAFPVVQYHYMYSMSTCKLWILCLHCKKKPLSTR